MTHLKAESLRCSSASRKTFKEAEPDTKGSIHPTAPSEKYLPVVETFHSVQGEGAWVGTNAFFIRLGGCDVGCPWCFTSETLILMADLSQKPIKDIRVGDEVMTLEKGKLIRTEVIAVHSPRIASVIKLEFESGITTHCTPEHQYKLTKTNKLKQAQFLEEAHSINLPPLNSAPNDIYYRMGYLVGAVLGDGCRWIDTRGYLHCRFNLLDKDFALRIVACAESLGWSAKFAEFQRKGKEHRPEYRVDITTQNTIEAFNEAVNDFYENYQCANQSYRLGFLGGFFDAEGTVSGGRCVCFSQKTNHKVVDILEFFIKELGFEYSRHDGITSGMTVINLKGGWRNLVKFLSLINPAIARKVSKVSGEGKSQSLKCDKVVNRYEVGQTTVYNFATRNGYYFANQHLVKNCDTKHSWNALRHPQQNIAELVRQARTANPGIVVITGGEPLMHNLDDLTRQLRSAELRVHLETSGAHPFSGTFDWVTFSPKRFKPSHKSLYPHVHELKVVVADSSDLEWAESQIASVPSSAVKYLQPEWNTPDSHNLIFEYVLRHPEWRISLQTHKFLKIR